MMNTYTNETTCIVEPALAGTQLVRFACPLLKGALRLDDTIEISDGEKRIPSAIRILTKHPKDNVHEESIRCLLLTFIYSFRNLEPVRFRLKTVHQADNGAPSDQLVDIAVVDETVRIVYQGVSLITARLMAPSRINNHSANLELVESTPFFTWKRFTFPDPFWPRIIEVRMDSLGTVAMIAHLQRNLPGDGRMPDFGWQIDSATMPSTWSENGVIKMIDSAELCHSFSTGQSCVFHFAEDRFQIFSPSAPLQKRGEFRIHRTEPSGFEMNYWRAKVGERIPHQQSAWRKAELVFSPTSQARLLPTLRYPHRIKVNPQLWESLYSYEPTASTKESEEMNAICTYHDRAIVSSMAEGDDLGNVTEYEDSRPAGAVIGMNRLNHCAPIFRQAFCTNHQGLLETALQWCDNFYEQSIWWGAGETGGTRYNDAVTHGFPAFENDLSFMWRENRSYAFCTKGFDSFLTAYEQTGDPRMLQALQVQVAYAKKYIHSDDGETRNIGAVKDFISLYKYTGEKEYLAEALRLFRELRPLLSRNFLFSQHGEPILPDEQFIDDDEVGYKFPFAKPYIVGYALSGLPELAAYVPEEPELENVIRSVADFLSNSQDPIGGWRYPHPRSSMILLGQSIEFAWLLVQADRFLGPQADHLDAIEKALRLRIWGYRRSGKIISRLTGWELATGKIKSAEEIYRLYKKPEDRDPHPDYQYGQITLGTCSPDGLVYFREVLDYYLQHRDEAKLLRPPLADDPLEMLMRRIQAP